jgi:hypothetical protein
VTSRGDRTALTGLSTGDEAPPSAPDENPAQPGAVATGWRARVRQLIRWRPTLEQLAVLLLGLLVLLVHDVEYMLRQSFWADEAWVAVSTRFPLSQLPVTTSSSPIGWSMLVRLVTVSGTQTSRLLPLAFAGAAVVTAYWFARGIGWRWEVASVTAGLAAALGVLLVPGMLVRDDLKQYTAEAFTALLTLALTSRLERKWSRAGLVALSISVWAGMLFSNAVAFVGIAAFAAVCIIQAARRAWRRLAEAVVAGGCTGILVLAVYEAFDARAMTPLNVSTYWPHFFLPVSQGLRANAAFVIGHFEGVRADFGLGPWWLAVPLVVAGLVTMVRLGRPATALAVIVLWPEMLTLSALKKYPFLNLRTSTFLFAITVVVAAIGLVGLCSLLRPRLTGWVAAGLGAVAVIAFAIGAQPYVRSHPIPDEDVRGQTLYVAAHAAPHDVIVVSLASNWGFAYYWPSGQPAHRATSADMQQYVAYFPDQPRIVVASARDAAGVDAALSHALAEARPYRCARIWLVRTHVVRGEPAAWAAALRRHGQSSTRIGPGGLAVIQAGGSACR